VARKEEVKAAMETKMDEAKAFKLNLADFYNKLVAGTERNTDARVARYDLIHDFLHAAREYDEESAKAARLRDEAKTAASAAMAALSAIAEMPEASQGE
jgi:hypothetical protein